MTGRKQMLYVGSYTEAASSGGMGGDGEGIYHYLFDSSSGSLTRGAVAGRTENPSFFIIQGEFLYTVNELNKDGGLGSGRVSSFAIDPVNGKLRLFNRQPTGGTNPCHISASEDGARLYVANYSSGSVASFLIREDGGIGERTDLNQLTGSGPDRDRQAGPHAHGVIFPPGGELLLVPNLGGDEIVLFRTDLATGKLRREGEIKTAPGAGPRLVEFHPSLPVFYAVNELNSTVAVYHWQESEEFTVECKQTLSTLYSSDPDPSNTAACLAVHPEGKVLYVSNRGEDSIAAFSIDPETGELKKFQTMPSKGKTPRHFIIDPTGGFLLVGNQESDNISVFSIAPRTGELKFRSQAEARTPVCLCFAEK